MDDLERSVRLKRFNEFADKIEDRVVAEGAKCASEVSVMKKVVEKLFKQSGGKVDAVTDAQIADAFLEFQSRE